MFASAKRFFTFNLGAKVLSLAIASLLWIAIVGEHELATAIDVPVEYRHFPKSFEVSSGMVNRVNLFVRGPSGKMNDSFLKDVAVVVDLEGVSRPGDWTFNLDNRAIRVGDWKLVSNSKGPWELYNLKTDRGETTNLATREPARAKALEEHWHRLDKQFEAQRTS